MRELKFKAWARRIEIPAKLEAIHNVMLPITALYFFDNGEVGSISVDTEYGEQEDILIDNHGNSIKILQYTGFKDCNGKEIYEGDIVRNLPYENGIVKCREGAYFVCSWRCFSITSESSHKPSNLEVIGNEFEDIELMGTWGEGVCRNWK